MIKTFQIGNTSLDMNNNMAWTFIYKSYFGKDAAEVLIPAISGAAKSDTEDDTEVGIELFGDIGFCSICEIMWSCAKLANKDIPNVETWVANFGDDFSLDAVMDAFMFVVEGLVSTKNFQTPAKTKAKKTPAKK